MPHCVNMGIWCCLFSIFVFARNNIYVYVSIVSTCNVKSVIFSNFFSCFGCHFVLRDTWRGAGSVWVSVWVSGLIDSSSGS